MDPVVRSENLFHLEIPSRAHSNSASIPEDTLAMMLPEECHALTAVVDSREQVFFYTALRPEHLFLARPHWRVLGNIFPPNSIVHGVVYRNKRGVLVMGVFDASKLNGMDLHSMPQLDRHVLVHKTLHAAQPIPHIQYHWTGYKETCYKHICAADKPFECHQMLVFGAAGNMRVLGSLVIARPNC
jgi:hypothetical protein